MPKELILLHGHTCIAPVLGIFFFQLLRHPFKMAVGTDKESDLLAMVQLFSIHLCKPVLAPTGQSILVHLLKTDIRLIDLCRFYPFSIQGFHPDPQFPDMQGLVSQCSQLLRYGRLPMLRIVVIVFKLVNPGPEGISPAMHGRPGWRASLGLAIGINEGSTHGGQAIDVRGLHIPQFAHLLSVKHHIERPHGIVTVIVRKDPQDVWLLWRDSLPAGG